MFGNKKTNQSIKAGRESVNIQIGEIVVEKKPPENIDYFEVARLYSNSLKSSFLKEKTLMGKIIDLSKEYVSLKAIDKHPLTINSNDSDFIVLSRARTRDVTIDELLSWEHPVLIISGAGTGKTTLLKHIIYLLCADVINRRIETYKLPVYLTLKQLDLSALNIYEYLLKKCAQHIPAGVDNTDVVEYWLNNGHLTLLLDGFDEVVGDIQEIVENIISFIKKYPSTRIIVASRPVIEDLHIFKKNDEVVFREVGVAPLNKAQKLKFCETYLSDAEKAQELLYVINNNDHIRAISTIPIYLLLIISLFEEDFEEDIEITNITDFYNESCAFVLGFWPKKKGVSLQFGTYEKVDLLSRLSFLCLERRTHLSQRLIGKVFEEPSQHEKIFYEIIETSGMLRPIGYEKYEFVHKTFMEYLAALHINKLGFTSIKNNLTLLVDDNHTEVFLFLCAMLADSTELLKELIDRNCNTYLVALCLTKSTKVDANIQVEAENFLLRNFRASNSLYAIFSNENRALKIMHNLPNYKEGMNLYQKFIDMLVNPSNYSGLEGKLNKQETVEIKTEALRYLVHNHCRRTMVVLLEQLLDENNEIWIKFKAASALSYMQGESILPQLKEAYAKELNGDDDIRITVIEAVIRTASNDEVSAVKFLEAVSKQDSSLLARNLSQVGIENIKSENNLIDKVVMDCADDRYASIKRIYHSDVLDPIELIEMFVNKSYPRRLDVGYMLRDASPGKELGLLIKLLNDPDENDVFKCEAVKIIGIQGSEPTNAILLNYYLNI